MHRSTEKGTKVNRTVHHAKTLSSSTISAFATARALLGISGCSSALSSRALAARCLSLVALGAAFALALFAPGSASAAFTRPFLRQLSGSTPGSHFSFFSEKGGGIAVDSGDNLWVANPNVAAPPFPLDKFDSSGAFLQALTIEGPESFKTPPVSLAINRSTGTFYATGESHVNFVTKETFGGANVEVFESTGAFIGQWEQFGSSAYVAVDNSTEPSAGTIYVSHSSRNPPENFGGDGLPSGVEKLNASGEPVNFSGSAPYIAGNQITGDPHASFESGGKSPGSITVDSHGNIYVANPGAREGVPGEEPTVSAVDEYSPNGIFVRAFTFKKTPGLGGSHEDGGVGGSIGEGAGIAVDPVSGHVLAGVNRYGVVREAAVDEFSSSGEYLNQITETAPGHRLQRISQMTFDSTGDLYFVDGFAEQGVDTFGPGHFLPSLKLAETTQRKPTSALLDGSVNPEGLSLSDCHFEYVPQPQFEASGFASVTPSEKAACAPSAGSIPVDSEYHSVHAEVTGLTSGTTFRYRLVATTSGALGGTEASGSAAFTAPAPPRIDSTTAANVSSTFADLHAQIDPLGADTAYQFQVLSATEFQENGNSFEGLHTPVLVPTTRADIGSGEPDGNADESVVQQIGGLQPGTAYHFRVIATNEIGVIAGPDSTFSTSPQISPGLPDHRSYELVTPPNKGSAADMFAEKVSNGEYSNTNNVGYTAETGDAFLFETRAAFGPFSASGENAYVFSRQPEKHEWAFASLASPSLGVQSLHAPVFDPFDLSQVGVEDSSGSGASTGGGQPLNLVGAPGGPYMTIHADSPLVLGEQGSGDETMIVGGSHDLTKVVIQSKNHTLASALEGQDEGSVALYEWAGGKFKPLDVNSKGSLLSRCGGVLGQGTHEGLGNIKGGTHSAVSRDGSKVFFTAPDPNMSPALNGPGGTGCWNGAAGNAPQVYLRAGKSTVEVSASEAGVSDPSGTHIARFVGASEDGSRAYFVTETELTASDEGIHDPELYEWRSQGTTGPGGACAATEGCLTRISAGEPGTPGSTSGAAVYAVPAISVDGSAVYFAALGRLTTTAPTTLGEHEAALYRYDSGTATITYVTTVDTRDYLDGLAPSISPNPVVDYYTSPNGRYLLFGSIRDITGYDNAGPCYIPNDPSGEPAHRCSEVYRYDSATGDLACLSCNPSGVSPISNAQFSRSASSTAPAGPVRALSNDGSYAFFDTTDPLVPQDNNGAVDVYEWHNGKISLISSGHDPAPSFFLGASQDGSNVFFGTHARLVQQDTDTAGDLYDARICTEADPCIKPPTGETAQCEGDACQSQTPVPLDATPGSLTFSGAGNLLSKAGAPTAEVNQKAKKAARLKAEKLSRALKACKIKRKKKQAGKKRRAACERQARKKYAPASKKGKR
jgi:hypothetical protein